MRISTALQPGDLVFDTDEKLDRLKARALRAAGGSRRVAVARYTFYGPPRPSDLDKQELDDCLVEDLIVFTVQHPPGQRWTATATLGSQNVAAAIAQAQRAGYVTSPGQRPLSNSSDMEDVANVGPGPQGYQRAWRDGNKASNYSAVGYLGFACGLTLADALLIDDCAWWCDGALLEDRLKLPYALKQELPYNKNVGGVHVDTNVVLLGDLIWGLYEDGTDLGDPAIPIAVDPT